MSDENTTEHSAEIQESLNQDANKDSGGMDFLNEV